MDVVASNTVYLFQRQSILLFLTSTIRYLAIPMATSTTLQINGSLSSNMAPSESFLLLSTRESQLPSVRETRDAQ